LLLLLLLLRFAGGSFLRLLRFARGALAGLLVLLLLLLGLARGALLRLLLLLLLLLRLAGGPLLGLLLLLLRFARGAFLRALVVPAKGASGGDACRLLRRGFAARLPAAAPRAVAARWRARAPGRAPPGGARSWAARWGHRVRPGDGKALPPEVRTAAPVPRMARRAGPPAPQALGPRAAAPQGRAARRNCSGPGKMVAGAATCAWRIVSGATRITFWLTDWRFTNASRRTMVAPWSRFA
jgi:hypothetical protein